MSLQGRFAFQQPPACRECGRRMTMLAGTDWFCVEHPGAADYFRRLLFPEAVEELRTKV